MLQILLHILAVIGIIILILLGILILLICTILFVPVYYRVNASKDEKTKDSPNVFAKITYLYPIFSFVYEYPDWGNNKLRILGVPVFWLGKAKEERCKKQQEKEQKRSAAKQNEKKKKNEKKKSRKNTPGVNTALLEKPLEEKAADTKKIIKIEPIDGNNARTDRDEEKAFFLFAWYHKFVDRIKSIFEKIRYTFFKICDTLRNIKDSVSQIGEAKDYYISLLKEDATKELYQKYKQVVLKIVKKCKPEIEEADVTFGTGSPDTTGYIMAIYGILYGTLGETVRFTPDFENTILQGQIKLKGKIQLYVFVGLAIKIFTDKKLKVLLKKLKREDV